MDVAAIRREIVGIDCKTYLNTGGLGLMPLPTRAELQDQYAALGATLDPTAWYRRCVTSADGLREQIGRFVAASPDEIALKTSVADGYGTVLWGLSWQAGDEILVTSEEHPTARLAVELAARQFGATVKVVPVCPTSDEFLAALQQALGPRTRLVAMSQITTDSGTHLPAERMCHLAHEAGAVVLFDGAHAVGQIPVDLHRLGCDFYSSMGYKWALGPMGSGFLYVRRDRQEVLRPIIGAGDLRWQDVAAGQPDPPPTARRFEFASRAWPEFFALGKSLAFLEAIGIANIQDHVGRLTAYLRERLATIAGVEIHTPSPPEPTTGILAFSLAGTGARDLSRALDERWNIAQRPAMMVGREGGIRVSVAVYTSLEEVDNLIAAVSELARASPRGNAG